MFFINFFCNRLHFSQINKMQKESSHLCYEKITYLVFQINWLWVNYFFYLCYLGFRELKKRKLENRNHFKNDYIFERIFMLWKTISLHVLVFFFKEVHSEKDKSISLFSDIIVLSNIRIRIHINNPIPLCVNVSLKYSCVANE